MDPRLGILALAYVLWLVIFVADEVGVRVNEKFVEEGVSPGLVGKFLAALLVPVFIALGGWFDMLLWNMVAPVLGLPAIDLLTAIALGWLTISLFKGMVPSRVRVVSTPARKNGRAFARQAAEALRQVKVREAETRS